MPNAPVVEKNLELVSPDGTRQLVAVAESPFLLGRGGDSGNHLQLADRRISRQCAAIITEDNDTYLEDRGHQLGIFVNGERISRRKLKPGDEITFGVEDSYKIIFRSEAPPPAAPGDDIEDLLSRVEHMSSAQTASGGIGSLSLLLEASTLLHSRLPLEAILATMVDHAITLLHADRGMLLETNESGALRPRLARMQGGKPFDAAHFNPSQTAIRAAIEKESSVITEDMTQAGAAFQAAQSVVMQALRAVVVVPLYEISHAHTAETFFGARRGGLLGVLYLDSRRPAAFSTLDRKILDALAADAASVLDNARLVERDHQRRRYEQELNIARDIQQALLPRGLGRFGHLDVTGSLTPCSGVGGDYYDVFPLDDGRTAFLISDVSGKGLGAALLTTMLQGAISGLRMGIDPTRVFNNINHFLCQHEEVGRHATMFFGIADSDGAVKYLNAGHPSPILVRRGQTSELYTAGSLPLGLVPEAEYRAARAQLQPGDTLALFSDGVTEANDPENRLYGFDRLYDVLRSGANADLGSLQTQILESVDRFAHGAEQSDDITVLLVRYLADAVPAETAPASTP